MPRRVEPKSESVFRAAKARARSYLLADGNGLALRVPPNGTQTWLLRYRRPSTSKENFLGLGPYTPPMHNLRRHRHPCMGNQHGTGIFLREHGRPCSCVLRHESHLRASDRTSIRAGRDICSRNTSLLSTGTIRLAARGAQLSCSHEHIFLRRVLIYLRDHDRSRSRDLRTANLKT